MKFFKHFTDSHTGKSMMALMDEFGLEGYAAWFILVELCASKLEKNRDEEFNETHCKFIFNERLLREKLRFKSTKVELFLNLCSTKTLLLNSKVGNEFHIYMPKLLEYMDRDSKRTRPARAVAAPKIKIEDKEEDKDKEEEKKGNFIFSSEDRKTMSDEANALIKTLASKKSMA